MNDNNCTYGQGKGVCPIHSTPGPWHLNFIHEAPGISGARRQSYIYDNKKRKIVCAVPIGTNSSLVASDTQKANARLIAASPELLMALEKCVAAISDEISAAGKDEVNENPILKHHAQIAKHAEIIIRKAKGQ